MKKLYFWSIYSTVFIAMIASCFFSANRISAENSFVLPRNDPSAGLKKVVLTAPEGKITVNLPDDIRRGDTISSYLYAVPEGKTEAERQTNLAALNNYVVDIAGARQTSWKTAGEALDATISFDLTARRTPEIQLRSKTGATISTDPLTFQEVSVTIPPVSSPTVAAFVLPTIGQQGRPVIINSPESRFNGSFSDTSVKVGEKESLLLAESPRQAVVMVPESEPGETEIALNEGKVEQKASFRSIALKLAASRTNLNKGESTPVSVTVSGLRNLKNAIPVQLKTIGTGNMQGGNLQTIIIKPDQVSPEGIFTVIRTFTATQAGGFGVSATVMPVTGGQGKCECKCQLNDDKPIVSAGKRSVKDVGTEYSYEPNVKVASCNGDRCEVSSITYVWSVGAGSTATYKVRAGTDKAEKLVVDVTGDGTLELTVAVTVKCSDGSECSDTGSLTFSVKK